MSKPRPEYNYLDEYGFVLSTNPLDPDRGKGDGCHTVSNLHYGLICALKHTPTLVKKYIPNYNHYLKKFVKAHVLLSGMEKKEGLGYVYVRHPEIEKGTSRDQLSMLFLVLSMLQKNKLLSHVYSLKFRISEMANQSPDFWLWCRSLVGRRRFYSWIFLSGEILIHPLRMLWNLIMKIMGGYWTKRKGLKDKINKKEGKWHRAIAKLMYPMYAEYNLVHQVIRLKDSFLRRIVERILLMGIEEENIYLRALLGDYEITERDIKTFVPFANNEWNNRFDGSVFMWRLEEEEVSDLEIGRFLLICANGIYLENHKK